MRPILVVVAGVLTDQTEEVTLAEHLAFAKIRPRPRKDRESVQCPASGSGRIRGSQPRPRHLPIQDRELLPQREVLEHQARPWAQECAERSKDRCDDGEHDASLAAGPAMSPQNRH